MSKLQAQAFQPAGSRDIPVPCSRLRTGDWKVARTRRQGCLRYLARRASALMSLLGVVFIATFSVCGWAHAMKSRRIRLFIKPYCGWCDEAKEWLDERGLSYEMLDV